MYYSGWSVYKEMVTLERFYLAHLFRIKWKFHIIIGFLSKFMTPRILCSIYIKAFKKLYSKIIILCQVIVVTQAGVHWYVCTCPQASCIHIRQCIPVCVTTNMLHFKVAKEHCYKRYTNTKQQAVTKMVMRNISNLYKQKLI